MSINAINRKQSRRKDDRQREREEAETMDGVARGLRFFTQCFTTMASSV